MAGPRSNHKTHKKSTGSNAEASGGSASAATSGSESTTTLLISSLPPKYTSDSLSALLSSIGPIRVAFIVTSTGEEKRSKGYGFGKFVLKEDAEKAIADLNNTLIDGKRISVQWAQRRQRVKPGEEEAVAGPSFATAESTEVKENVQNAYAARRQHLRDERQQTGEHVDNRKDSRTVVLEGGLDTSLPEHKKALQNRLKKVVTGINTGMSTLHPSEIVITSSTSAHKSIDAETGQSTDVTRPITLLEVLAPRTAQQLAQKLHNTVIKGHLILAKVKFESDLLGRKGAQNAEGRLIVRNLGFDVTEQDLAAVFAPHGQIKSIQLHKGFAFVWFIHPADAEKAIAAVNGKRVYAGLINDRIEESANHKLSSTVRKEQKGRIVGVKGRIVAVDKALSKEAYEKLETQDETEATEDATMTGQDGDIQPEDDDDEVEEDENEEENSDDDLSPVEAGIEDDLEGPSDVESSEEEEAKPEDQGTTLFVRNIMFEATEDELYTLFKGFGPVRYARIVMDPVTKRSRGTGFVNFYKEEDAVRCLNESDKLASLTSTESKGKDRMTQHTSLLTMDPSSSLAASLTLHGRVLGVSTAVTKGQADKLREERDKQGKTKDRRNLYLMHEGVVLPDSPLAATLSTADIQARESAFENRRGLLRTNPALYVSRTRLAIRQIPLFVTDGMLRRIAGWAMKAFNNDVKAGKRTKLTIDDLREPVDVLGAETNLDGTPAEPKSKTQLKKEQNKVRQAKILRQDDRVDPLTGLKRSKGYGFLEMTHHADALRVLRWANANQNVHKVFHTWWKEDLKQQIEELSAKKDDDKSKDEDSEARVKRMQEKLKELEAEDSDKIAGRQGKTLIIEFSIENAVTVKRRAEKSERTRQKATAVKRKRAAEEEEEEQAEAKAQAEAEAEAKAAKKGGKRKKGDENGTEEKERNPLGSIIGKKRRINKEKRKGPRK